MKFNKIFQSIDWNKRGNLTYVFNFIPLFIYNARFSLVDFLKSLKKLGWSIFINAKSILLKLKFPYQDKIKAMILKNRCDIVETTCLMVLSLAFIIEKSQEFLTAKSDLFEGESNLLVSFQKF